MEPKFNLWIEHNGVVVLSEWRARLLDAIDQTGSISRAADRMKITYHRAWEKLHEMEVGLGEKLVSAQVGGTFTESVRLAASLRLKLMSELFVRC